MGIFPSGETEGYHGSEMNGNSAPPKDSTVHIQEGIFLEFLHQLFPHSPHAKSFPIDIHRDGGQ